MTALRLRHTDGGMRRSSAAVAPGRERASESTAGPEVHVQHQEVRRLHVADGGVAQQVHGEAGPVGVQVQQQRQSPRQVVRGDEAQQLRLLRQRRVDDDDQGTTCDAAAAPTPSSRREPGAETAGGSGCL